MNEQTTQLLQQLAEKLNTTAENLWAILIAQARIEGIIALVWALGLSILLIVVIKAVKWLYDGVRDGDFDDIAIVPIVLLAIFGLVLPFPILINLTLAITCLLNPDYYALRQILWAIK